jgi:hypothetical protein
MKYKAVLAAAGALAVLAGGQASAHHAANAVYDMSKMEVMKGELEKVAWVNPHARFYFFELDESGKRVSDVAWELETGGPATMRRLGMSGAGIMQTGATYTVSYRPARNGGKKGLMSILEFPDGKKFSQLPAN